MSIFAFIVLRGLNTALKEHDDFTRYAVGGLVIVFGLQSVINMCVNLQLMPAKGMTLPFISYGGSSLIAIAISMGMVLALTRKRPEKRKRWAWRPAAARRCRRSRMARGADPSGRRRNRRPSVSRPRRWRMSWTQRGWQLHLVTDDARPALRAASFPAAKIHLDPVGDDRARQSAGHAGRVLDALATASPGAPPSSAGIKPDAVVGFGGYPTVAAALAATPLQHADAASTSRTR